MREKLEKVIDFIEAHSENEYDMAPKNQREVVEKLRAILDESRRVRPVTGEMLPDRVTVDTSFDTQRQRIEQGWLIGKDKIASELNKLLQAEFTVEDMPDTVEVLVESSEDIFFDEPDDCELTNKGKQDLCNHLNGRGK